MTIGEKIDKRSEDRAVVVDGDVVSIIEKSGIEQMFLSLEEEKGVSIRSEILEEGVKKLFVLKWEEEGKQKQIIVLARKSGIKMIGEANQFIELNKNEIKKRKKVENSLVETFINPLEIEGKTK